MQRINFALLGILRSIQVITEIGVNNPPSCNLIRIDSAITEMHEMRYVLEIATVNRLCRDKLGLPKLGLAFCAGSVTVGNIVKKE